VLGTTLVTASVSTSISVVVSDVTVENKFVRLAVIVLDPVIPLTLDIPKKINITVIQCSSFDKKINHKI